MTPSISCSCWQLGVDSPLKQTTQFEGKLTLGEGIPKLCQCGAADTPQTAAPCVMPLFETTHWIFNANQMLCLSSQGWNSST